MNFVSYGIGFVNSSRVYLGNADSIAIYMKTFGASAGNPKGYFQLDLYESDSEYGLGTLVTSSNSIIGSPYPVRAEIGDDRETQIGFIKGNKTWLSVRINCLNITNQEFGVATAGYALGDLRVKK